MKEKLKLGLIVPTQEDTTARFKLVQDGNEVRIESDGEEWCIVGLRVVDEKVHLVRYSSVGDNRIATDSYGRIEETEE